MKWEESVGRRLDFTPRQKEKMLLSGQTRLGLRLTGKFKYRKYVYIL